MNIYQLLARLFAHLRRRGTSYTVRHSHKPVAHHFTSRQTSMDWRNYIDERAGRLD